tara:strand:+ start:4775 stop:5257 length:483 start_codon:yes stop_codon:yes gene_type:complete
MANLSDFILSGGSNPPAVFQDIRSTGVVGQSFNATESIIEFSDEITQKNFCSKSGNQFTLDEGTYDIILNMQCLFTGGSGNFQVWARDTSNVVYGGKKAYSSADLDGIVEPILFRIVVPSGGKTIEFIGEALSGRSMAQAATTTDSSSDEFYQELRIIPV